MRKLLYRTYLVSCSLAALVLGWFSFTHAKIEFDVRLLIFLIVLLQNVNYKVKDEQASFSIHYPLLFPVAALFGPGWVMVLAATGLISHDEFKDNHITAFLYNRGALSLAAGFSAYAYHGLGGDANFVLALFAAVLTYSLTNLGLFLISRIILKKSIRSNVKYVKESLKVILPASTLAALFYASYQWFDIFGVIAVYYLFTLIRSNLLLGHFEVNYRLSLIKALLRAVYAKDKTLMQHLENVAYYTKLLATNCDYPRWELAVLEEASYLHDIGKLEISDHILKKAGRLTEEEYREMCTNPVRGREFLKEILLPGNHKRILENIVCYHHEKYDGTGYPFGLKGEEIPLEARIVAIADAWDAMISERCYRPALAFETAIEELRREKGTQFDPKLVEIFIRLVDEHQGRKGPLYTSPDINVSPSQ